MVILGTVFVVGSLAAGSSQAEPQATATIARADVGSVAKFVKTHPNDYSGIYLDRNTGQYVIEVPDGADAAALLHNAAANSLASTNQQSVGVTIIHAERSLAQLRQIENQVGARYGKFGALAGDLVTQWSLNEQNNTVQVGVSRLDQGLIDAAKATYGDSVTLARVPQFNAEILREHVSGPVVDLTRKAPFAPSDVNGSGTRLIDTLPYAAGDRVMYYWPVSGGYEVIQCTNGWNAPVFMFTAGHCFVQGSPVYQGYATSSGIWYNGTIGSVNDVQWGNNRADFESVNPVGQSSLSHSVYADTVSSSAGLQEDQLYAAVQNSEICADGSFTGDVCGGTITGTEGCVNENDGGTTYYVCNQDFAQSSGVRLVQSGDSGGPVLIDSLVVGGNYVGSYGTISSGDSTGTSMTFTDGGDICSQSNEC